MAFVANRALLYYLGVFCGDFFSWSSLLIGLAVSDGDMTLLGCFFLTASLLDRTSLFPIGRSVADSSVLEAFARIFAISTAAALLTYFSKSIWLERMLTPLLLSSSLPTSSSENGSFYAESKSMYFVCSFSRYLYSFGRRILMAASK